MITILTRAAIIAAAIAVPTIADARPPEQGSNVDPQAISALENMSAFLRDQQSFTVRTTTQTDYVLDSGQTVRLGGQAELRARRPDRLRIDMTSDRKTRQFYYDGKTFTIYSPRIGYYASVAAPPTIVALADQLQDTYGVALPMVDLFRWGTDESDVGEITSATYVGTTRLDGIETDQYAFRQPGLDWQIWIQRGDHPLPRKLVLTATDDRARPDYTVEMAWDLDVKHDDTEFTFTPRKDRVRVALAEVGAPPIETVRKARKQ